ncbi:hypothetical protein DRQ53_14020 [bacterium]|nr:MAG: hypothetical protein DRQ32_06125 [bacterium]RKZ12973.1 MAG: hypothetical protein DRQ53_14020 [bacterium]
MKAFLTLALLLLIAAPTLAEHHEGGESEMPAMGPPAEMKALAFMLGEWDVAMDYREGPEGEWVTIAGSAVSKSVLDGCAHRMDFEATLMGMPFKGFDHTTYNREYGRYESVWMDNMSAKMGIMRGNFEGDELIMQGPDKMQGMEFLARSVSTKVSNDEIHFAMSMSVDDGATWFENMKMVYTRKN